MRRALVVAVALMCVVGVLQADTVEVIAESNDTEYLFLTNSLDSTLFQFSDLHISSNFVFHAENCEGWTIDVESEKGTRSYIMRDGRIIEQDRLSILFKDYKYNEWDRKPIGAGLLTWTNDEYDMKLGVYGQMAIIQWHEIIRFNAGAAFIWDDEKSHGNLIVRPVTSVTMAFSVYEASFEVGAYYAPFWGLDSRTDDPYGVMLGYLF